ncbi:unnamed protein product [Brassica rapa subsp. narinosa]
MTDTTALIPTEKYRFRKYKQLMVLANTNIDFSDVFGDACGIKRFKATYSDKSRQPYALVCLIWLQISFIISSRHCAWSLKSLFLRT